MTIDQMAKLLIQVAIDAVVDVMPEARSREWDIEQEIRYALRRQLALMRAAQPIRRKKSKGGVTCTRKATR